MAPVGGREAREKATAPLHGVTDADMGGQFNNKNPGKRGISLNVRHPKGLEIAKRLVAIRDIVAEGFSPGRARRLGPGLRRAAQDQARHHLRAAVGDGRAAPTGASARSARSPLVCGPVGDVGAARARDAGRLGLLVPRLDGRLQLRAGHAERALPSRRARARASGSMHRRPKSASSSAARRSSIGRPTAASGRAPATARPTSRPRRTAPIRCAGEDRWIAIACFTEDEWRALTDSGRAAGWAADPRFATLAGRLATRTRSMRW